MNSRVVELSDKENNVELDTGKDHVTDSMANRKDHPQVKKTPTQEIPGKICDFKYKSHDKN